MYPAGEPGITVRYVANESGMSLRVLESGPRDGKPVVLVHGWSANVYSFSETIPALAQAGYRAIAFDLPGHGLSDKPIEEANYRTEALADAILAVAASARATRFTLVGHSLGGSLGLHLALRRVPELERLVLINSVGLGVVPIVWTLKPLTPPLINRVLPALLTRQTIAAILRLAYTSRRPRRRDIEEYWAPTQFDEFAWACRACLHQATWRTVPRAKLRTLNVPVLVITGGRDILVRHHDARARSIPSVTTVDVPHGGHVVLQECAVETNTALLQFLGRT